MKIRLTSYLAGALTLLCLAAVPSHNASDTGSWSKWQEIGALDNCNAAAINVAVDCGDIRVQGYNALTLEIFYDYAAGTGYQFNLETCYEGFSVTDCTDATDWHTVAVQFPAPSSVVLTPATISRVVSADDTLTWTFGVNYKRIRVANVVATGSPTASDKITIYARLGWLQDF